MAERRAARRPRPRSAAGSAGSRSQRGGSQPTPDLRAPGRSSSALLAGWGEAISPGDIPSVAEATTPRSQRRQEQPLHEQLRALQREFETLLRQSGRQLTPEEHDTRALRYRIAVLEAEKDHRREKYSRLKTRLKKRDRADAAALTGDVSGMAQQLAAQDRIIAALREENKRLEQSCQDWSQAQSRGRSQSQGAWQAADTGTAACLPGERSAVDVALERSERFFQDAIGLELERIASVPTRVPHGRSAGAKAPAAEPRQPGLGPGPEPGPQPEPQPEPQPQQKTPQRDGAGKRALTEWLDGVGLSKYALPFTLEGFDDITLLVQLEPQEVEDLTLAAAMRSGHAIRFKRALTDLRQIWRGGSASTSGHPQGPSSEQRSQVRVATALQETVPSMELVHSGIAASRRKEQAVLEALSQPAPPQQKEIAAKSRRAHGERAAPTAAAAPAGDHRAHGFASVNSDGGGPSAAAEGMQRYAHASTAASTACPLTSRLLCCSHILVVDLRSSAGRSCFSGCRL